MKHALLEEIWAARERLAARHGYDLHKTMEYLRTIEAQHRDRLVTFAPRAPIRVAEPPARHRSVRSHDPTAKTR